LVEFE